MSAVSIQPAPERLNFAEHLFAINAARGDKIAYVDDHAELDYAGLTLRARRFATALRALGLRREERLLLCAHDTVDWPVAFLGCLYAGVVPVAVNTLLGAGDYAYMIDHSRARAVLVSSALLPTVQAAIDSAVERPEWLIVPGAGDAAAPGTQALDALMRTEGRLTDQMIDERLTAAGFDVAVLKRVHQREKRQIDALIGRNSSQAQAFGFLGTPAYIVGTVVFPGVPSMADFRQAIADARAKSG